MHNAVSVDCPYSFAVHIANEYCWILISGSLVLSADCIAAVKSCITLCGIEKKKDQSQLNLSQKSCVRQKCIKPFALYGHHQAFFLNFIFNLFFSDWISKFGHLRVGVFFFVLLLVDSLLHVVDCALFDAVVCVKKCCAYIKIICFWKLHRRKLIQSQ